MNSGPKGTQTGHADYAAARTRLFDLKAEDIGIAAPPDSPDVWGVAIDYPTAQTVATLVTLADGTVSLLLSEGPAFMGAGQHREVARAAEILLSDAQSLYSSLKPTADFSLPSNDRAHIYLLTRTGVLGEDVSDDESSPTQHRLAEMRLQGDAVIASIRTSCQSQEAGSQRFTTKDNSLQAKIIAGSVSLGALVGAIAVPERLPGAPFWAGVFMGGVIGLIVGFLGSGVLLMVMDAKRRQSTEE